MGKNWGAPEAEWVDSPIEGYRYGLQLSLTVPDIANSLVLCDRHAWELLSAGWTPILGLLRDWGWTTFYGSPPDPEYRRSAGLQSPEAG